MAHGPDMCPDSLVLPGHHEDILLAIFNYDVLSSRWGRYLKKTSHKGETTDADKLLRSTWQNPILGVLKSCSTSIISPPHSSTTSMQFDRHLPRSAPEMMVTCHCPLPKWLTKWILAFSLG